MTVMPGQKGTAGMVLRNQVLVGTVNAAGATGNKLPKRSQPPTLAGWAG